VADQELTLELRSIEPGDRVTGLSVGDEAFLPLKTFLRRHAKSYQTRSLARTYAFIDGTDGRTVVAYVTLVCGEVSLDRGAIEDDGLSDYRYTNYPAIKIARLAVDSRLRKSGLKLGKRLVDLAVAIAKEVVSEHVGCRFVVVDSKQASVAFYEKMGFTLLDTEENRRRAEPILFVDLMKL
jgi:ribosomal protein S18 acetylase RimI-like enzyme